MSKLTIGPLVSPTMRTKLEFPNFVQPLTSSAYHISIYGGEREKTGVREYLSSSRGFISCCTKSGVETSAFARETDKTSRRREQNTSLAAGLDTSSCLSNEQDKDWHTT